MGIVTVQDYLIRKDPEKYEPIFKARAIEEKKAEKISTDRRELLKEIEELEKENAKLADENKKLVEENKILKTKVPGNVK
jgi:cell division protein FtsB